MQQLLRRERIERNLERVIIRDARDMDNGENKIEDFVKIVSKHNGQGNIR